MKWKIGKVKIDNQVVLAPMSGVCDYAFRSIIKSMGCGLLETEMISTKAVMYDNEKTKRMIYISTDEKPVSLQLFGSEIESFQKASRYISEHVNPSIIDINMGCPVKKVVTDAKAGSRLLKHPDKVRNIVECVVENVHQPVTVKIRSGWDKNSINALEIAGIVEEAGASAITVHPRTKMQGYEGHSDWNIIKDVKENVSIPVIGNGDINSCYDAKKMLDETGCDAVMIGRGVLGNPWLIRECIEYLENEKQPMEVSLSEKMEMLNKHADLLVNYKNEKIGMLHMRTHASYYIKNLPNNSRIREQIFQMKTREELINLIDDYLNKLK